VRLEIQTDSLLGLRVHAAASSFGVVI
jgi:hypothetical protein